MLNLEQEIQNCKNLQFQFKVEECNKKCLELLSKDQNLTEIMNIYGFTLQFTDPKQSVIIMQKIFDQNPYFFKNTANLLHITNQHFSTKGKKISKRIISLYEKYQGKKDAYYYISLSLAYEMEESEIQQKIQQFMLEEYNRLLSEQKKESTEDKDKCSEENQIELTDKEKIQIVLKTYSNEEIAWLYHYLGKEKMYGYFMDQEKEDLLNDSMYYLEESLKIQPRNTFTMQSLALLLVQQEGDDEKLYTALQIYEDAIQINPQDLVMSVYYCELLIKLEDYSKCDEILKENMKYKQTPYIFNNYLQYVQFSCKYRFQEFNFDFDNLFELLNQMVEYDFENYYNFDSLSLLIYIIQNCKQFNNYKQQISNILDVFSVSYPSFSLKLKSLVGYNPQIQNFLNLYQQKLEEQEQRTFLISAYQKMVEPEIIYMSKYSHWDLQLN